MGLARVRFSEELLREVLHMPEGARITSVLFEGGVFPIIEFTIDDPTLDHRPPDGSVPIYEPTVTTTLTSEVEHIREFTWRWGEPL